MKNLDREIVLEYIRASGPGGQNVNKVASAVQLRFDVAGSPSLNEESKKRLIQLAGKRATGQGLLIIEAHRYRTQDLNRADAIRRFYELVAKAAAKPKPRRPTRPTKASKEERLMGKRKRGEIKKNRRAKSDPLD